MAADLLLHARGRLQVRLARGAAHGTCVARSQRTALRDARRGGTARDRTQIGAAGRRRRLCRRTLPPCVTRTAGSRRTLLPGGRHIGRMGPHGFVPRRRAGCCCKSSAAGHSSIS